MNEPLLYMYLHISKIDVSFLSLYVFHNIPRIRTRSHMFISEVWDKLTEFVFQSRDFKILKSKQS